MRGRHRHAPRQRMRCGDRAGRFRALGHFPVPDRPGGRAAQDPAHRLRRPLPRLDTRTNARRHARDGRPSPELEHGREDQRRLRDHDEQGPGIHRGHAPVRRHAGRYPGAHPPGERRALDGRAARRHGHRPARRAGHGPAHPVCAHVSGAQAQPQRPAGLYGLSRRAAFLRARSRGAAVSGTCHALRAHRRHRADGHERSQRNCRWPVFGPQDRVSFYL